MKEQQPDFSGKVVLVGFHGSTERSYGYLKSPTFVTHHGRVFLVGEEAIGGLTTGIPWDSVTYYTIGNTPADFQKARRLSTDEAGEGRP